MPAAAPDAGTAYLDAAIDAARAIDDETRELLIEIGDLRTKKLWHELTLAIERAVAAPIPLLAPVTSARRLASGWSIRRPVRK